MADPSGVTCVRCQSPADHLGQLSLVTGGSSGAAKLFFGQWAELGEQNWPVDVYRCTHCGHVEMFDPRAIRD